MMADQVGDNGRWNADLAEARNKSRLSFTWWIGIQSRSPYRYPMVSWKIADQSIEKWFSKR
jgi:hypothetical protein